MKFHSCDNYQACVTRSIQYTHHFHAMVSLNQHKQPIIGYGFNLTQERNLLCFLNAIGFDTTGEFYSGAALEAELGYVDAIKSVLGSIHQYGIEIAQTNLDSIMLERYFNSHYKRGTSNQHSPDRRKVFGYLDEAEARLTVKLIANACEHVLDYWLLTGHEEMVVRSAGLFTHDKRERAALISMVARGAIAIDRDGERSLPLLHQALLDHDRINAWYQIRYNSKPFLMDDDSETIYAYCESELFGLYDMDCQLSKSLRETSKSIYQMYNDNRETIMAHEKRNAPLINQANIDFKLYGANKIKTIEQSFKIAYDAVRNTHRNKFGVHGKHSLSQQVA